MLQLIKLKHVQVIDTQITWGFGALVGLYFVFELGTVGNCPRAPNNQGSLPPGSLCGNYSVVIY